MKIVWLKIPIFVKNKKGLLKYEHTWQSEILKNVSLITNNLIRN